MNDLKVNNGSVTLVDQVEDKLFSYISNQKLVIGDPIPNESILSEALGVSRSVLREALSRLRMLGVIESRTKRGMVLSEPNMFSGLQRVMEPMLLDENHMLNLLGFRVALESGICNLVMENIDDEHIRELENIVERGGEYEFNFYRADSEFEFHSKLYEITENQSIMQFQEIIYPVCQFIRDKFKDFFEPINQELMQNGKLVTHKQLLNLIKSGDKVAFRRGMESHLAMYTKFLKSKDQNRLDC